MKPSNQLSQLGDMMLDGFFWDSPTMYPWHVARNASETWVKLSPKLVFKCQFSMSNPWISMNQTWLENTTELARWR
jgi:hypothetical protein